MSEPFPIGYPAPAMVILNYTATIQTDSNHSFTWVGQQVQGETAGITLTNAQLTALATAMGADIANQMINGTPGGAPSFQTQRANNTAHG